jgi:hypothetical protein
MEARKDRPLGNLLAPGDYLAQDSNCLNWIESTTRSLLQQLFIG